MFVVDGGVAHERTVVVAHRSGQLAAISDGMRLGERVVLYPPSALSDGASVRER